MTKKQQDSKTLTSDGFKAYKKYLAYKSHFTREHYDYFKYHGQINASADSFAKRKDSYFFHKLSRIVDYEDFLLANFAAKNTNVWIGNLVNDQQYKDCYVEWKKVTSSLGYYVPRELDRLQEENSCTFQELFLVKDGQHPVILREYVGGNCRIETIILVDRYLKIFDYWSKILDDPLMREINTLSSKYRGFIQINNDQIKQYILTHTKK